MDLVIKALKNTILSSMFFAGLCLILVTEEKSRLPALKVDWMTELETSILLAEILESIVTGGADVWSGNHKSRNSDNVRLAHNLNLEVYACTVNIEQDMQQMIDLSADASPPTILIGCLLYSKESATTNSNRPRSMFPTCLEVKYRP